MNGSSSNGDGKAFYLLQAEGQNFDWVIYDTHDLSTIAGGSQLLEQVPLRVEKSLQSKVGSERVYPIQRKASTGIFAFVADRGEAQSILAAVRGDLRNGGFAHLTVSVEVVEIPRMPLTGSGELGDILKRIEVTYLDRLRAAIRLAQMRNSSVAIPQIPCACDRPCTVDHVRPATSSDDRAKSASVEARRKLGKLFRWNPDPESESIPAVQTFEEMTTYEKGREHRWNGRLAVISIDGSGFGRLRTSLSRDAAGFARFSGELQGMQERFWSKLTQKWSERRPREHYFYSYEPNGKPEDRGRSKGDLLRLQRLMSAGDDAVYLMPAWLAWPFLDAFFSFNWELTFDDQLIPLKFRAGVVICNAKAPIHPIRDLAQKLESKVAKEAGGGMSDPIAYEILKSFDLLGARLEDYRAERRPKGLGGADVLLEGKKLGDLFGKMKLLDREQASSTIKCPERWPSEWSAADRRTAVHLSQWRDFLGFE